jgi:hypothetical protein
VRALRRGSSAVSGAKGWPEGWRAEGGAPGMWGQRLFAGTAVAQSVRSVVVFGGEGDRGRSQGVLVHAAGVLGLG